MNCRRAWYGYRGKYGIEAGVFIEQLKGLGELKLTELLAKVKLFANSLLKKQEVAVSQSRDTYNQLFR